MPVPAWLRGGAPLRWPLPGMEPVASCSSAPHRLSLAAAGLLARWFPSERGVGSTGCIIDNAVIYLCVLGYSKRLSLSELNIVSTGSVSLSRTGRRCPAVCLFFVHLRDSGTSPGDPAWSGGSLGQELGVDASGGAPVPAVGLGAPCLEPGRASCMEIEPEQQLRDQGCSAQADPPGGWLLLWKPHGMCVGVGGS